MHCSIATLVCVVLAVLVSTAQPASSDACYDYADRPRFLGSMAFPADLRAVAVDGSTVYVASRMSGLIVGDISDLRDPRAIASLDVERFELKGQDVAQKGDTLYLACDGQGLVVIDVTDPLDPTQVGALEDEFFREVVHYRGGFLALSPYALRVISLDDPLAPTIRTSLPIDVGGETLHVHGNTAWIAGGNGGVLAVDVSDPDALRVVGSFEVESDAVDVVADDELAFVVDRFAGLVVFDVSDRRAPRRIGAAAIDDGVQHIFTRVARHGNRLYLADGEIGVRVYDVSDPTQPRQVAMLNAARVAYTELEVEQDLLYAPSSRGGLQIYDMSRIGPEPRIRVQPALSSDPLDLITDLEARGRYVVASGLPAMQVYDTSTRGRLELVATLESRPIHGTGAISMQGDLAVLAASNAGFRVVDVSDLREPRELARVKTYGGTGRQNSVQDVEIVGDVAFAATVYYEPALHAFDLSNPREPALLETIPMPDSYAIAYDGGLLAVANFRGIAVVGVANPRIPELLWTQDLPQINWGIAVRDKFVFTAGTRFPASEEQGFFQVIDLSEPRDPIMVADLDMPGEARRVELDGQFAYVTLRFGPVVVVDVGDPRHPVAHGIIEHEGIRYDQPVTSVGTKDGIVLGGRYHQFLVVPRPCEGRVQSLEPTPMPITQAAFRPLRTSANPTRSPVSITLASPLSAGTTATIEVFDVRGRLVRALEIDSGMGASVVWDLRDGSGVRVSSGIYHLRLDAGRVTSTQKLLVLR